MRTAGTPPDTLIHRVLHTLYQRGEYNPKQEQSFTPALCNRIDRNTCGLVIVAKTAAALRVLNEKIRNREVQKEYLCVAVGVPGRKQGTLKNYLLKDSSANRVKVFDAPRPGAKTAITHYRVLTSSGNLSWCRSGWKPVAPIRFGLRWPISATLCWGMANMAWEKKTAVTAWCIRPSALFG